MILCFVNNSFLDKHIKNIVYKTTSTNKKYLIQRVEIQNLKIKLSNFTTVHFLK